MRDFSFVQFQLQHGNQFAWILGGIPGIFLFYEYGSSVVSVVKARLVVFHVICVSL